MRCLLARRLLLPVAIASLVSTLFATFFAALL